MGQALYRKYRSKQLDDVIGQVHITTTLKNALKTGKISHAYLFTGPRGVGKTSVARILAHAVNGFDYTDANSYLDIIEIDAASNRRIDEVRDLRDKVHIAPTSGKYKVYIIDEVHMLTKEAFNALLKTLEEPPAHVIFILATTEAHKLPETIVSRTQRFSFKPISPADVIAHLRTIAKAEKLTVDDEALKLIAQHGEGSFRDSISLLDQAAAQSQQISLQDVRQLLGIAPTQAIEELIQTLDQSSPKAVLTSLGDLYGQGYSAASIAKQLGEKLRDMLMQDQAIMNKQAVSGLLKKLLEVPSSPHPERLLELHLLDVVFDNTPISIDRPKPPKAAPAEPAAKVVKADSQPAQDKSVAASSGAFSIDKWPEVLAAIKDSHNTLYSILRMGQPSFNDDTLTLSFAFAFHQKRINEAHNRQIIDEVIHTQFGTPISIQAVVAPASPKNQIKTKVPDTIKTISNIFGGAEVLDS